MKINKVQTGNLPKITQLASGSANQDSLTPGFPIFIIALYWLLHLLWMHPNHKNNNVTKKVISGHHQYPDSDRVTKGCEEVYQGYNNNS